MKKYVVYYQSPMGQKKVGEFKTLRKAEIEGRFYRRKKAQETKMWGAVIIYHGNKVHKVI